VERFHAYVAWMLDKVVAGEIKRLMLFAPPQHGKTELVSIRLPAFWLGHYPDDPVILTSYAAALAFRNSRHARRVVESRRYHRVFSEVNTNPASRAVDQWEIQGHRGVLVAAGVGGPITGHGARLAIIDDPFKNWEEAQSETTRRMVWDWWRATFRPRVWEDGVIVLIMTRWHTDDLAARILAQDADNWTVLRFPAISEGPGDPLGRAEGLPLCPKRFGAPTLYKLKEEIGTYAWSAEYQGSPKPMGGNLALEDWFTVVEFGALKPDDRVRAWDFAATEKKAAKSDPDYTVGTLLSRQSGTYYVENVVRVRVGPGEVEALVRKIAEADGKDVRVHLEQEPGSSGKLFVSSLIKALDGWRVHAKTPTGDKITRAMPALAQAEAGHFKLVRGPWNRSWLEEICAVPNAAHDDQWDSWAAAYQSLLKDTRVRTMPSPYGPIWETEPLTKREAAAVEHADTELHRKYAQKHYCPQCHQEWLESQGLEDERGMPRLW